MKPMCRNCRFVREIIGNPAAGVCRRDPPQITMGGASWPLVRIEDQTFQVPEAPDRTEYAADSWCYQFKRRWFWHRWLDRKFGARR